MEMTPRENVMAIFNRQQPESYSCIMKTVMFAPDPIMRSDAVPADGLEHKDSWGTTCIKLPDAPGKHPHITPENAVVKDVCKWREQLAVPSLAGLDWGDAEAFAAQADRTQGFVGFFCAQGLFERSHFLMGMEDAFCAYLEEPEAMYEMLSVIADYKMRALKEAALHIHPDVVLFQDDWGSKQNLFLPPDVWREIIKPLHTQIVACAHECGMLFIHHSDCYNMPVVCDMVDMGIDVWQGAIPQNDIVEAQRLTQGRLAIQGGVDSPLIDVDNVTEEQIVAEAHRAIDTYCPAGRFFPGQTSGVCFIPWVNERLEAELAAYGRQWAQEHPITEPGGLPS